MAKCILLFYYLCATASTSIFAQDTSRLTGCVLDSSGHAAYGASVELIKVGDSSRRLTITDSTGSFIYDSLAKDDYLLHISFVGYQLFSRKIGKTDFLLSDSIVDTFYILTDKTVLPVVSVTASRTFMSIETDKKVFNVAMMPGVSSGSASDVMKQIPLVDLDKDGNVTIHGKVANVLIDGKQSPYTDIATALQVIPAAGLDKVEVMTSPSAKFDAQGQGGVVNIILKKDKASGFHGLVNMDASSVPDFHSGTDFNIRKGKINVFGNVNFHDKTTTGDNTNRQRFLDAEGYATDLQESKQVHNKDLDTRLGLDYFINKNTTLTFIQSFSDRNSFSNSSRALDSGSIFLPMQAYQLGGATSDNHFLNNNSSLEFTRHFKKEGESLTTNFAFSDEKTESFIAQDYLQKSSLFPGLQNTGTHEARLFLVQTDYADRLGKSGKLEAGYKSSVRNDANNLVAMLDTTVDNKYGYSLGLSNMFHYAEQVHAVYMTYGNKIGKIDYKMGIRTELSIMNGHSYLQDISFSKQFVNVFPGIFFSRELTNGQTIGLNYTTRIARPTFFDLLPYTDVTNMLMHRSGNPNLSPAYIHNIAFEYDKLFCETKDFLSISVYYSRATNSIQPITTIDSTGITLTMPENIKAVSSFGNDITYRFRIGKIIHFTTVFEGSYTAFSDAQSLGVRHHYFMGKVRLNGEINMPLKLLLLAHGELTTPQILPQGYTNHNRGIDLEVRRNFAHNKIIVAIIVADVFNDRSETTHIETAGFIQDAYYKEQSRLLHLHCSFRF